MDNLAYFYNSQGRYSEAEPLYLQALEIDQQVFGENHPNTATVRKNLEISGLRDVLVILGGANF